MRLKSRIVAIILLTPILAGIITFLFYTSVDTHWGGGYWEHWLSVRLQIEMESAHLVVFWLRKTLHFCGYGCLGLLFWLYFFLWRVRKNLDLALALLATIVIAIADEYQQSLSTFRSGKPEDVIIDILGAMVFCGLYRILLSNHLKADLRK